MKKLMKRTAVTALCGILAAGALSGCGKKNEAAELDGTKTVATVNGTEIPMGILSLYVRNYQAQMEQMYSYYFGASGGYSIWDSAAGEEEDGKT